MVRRPAYTTVFRLLLASSFVTTAAAQKLNHNSYVGKEPPELVSKRDHWLGCQEQVVLCDLKGKVVWLQFNF